MNRLRVLLLTILISMLASHLSGQAYGRPQTDVYIQPVVCNDGTISVYMARAYLSVWFGRHSWLIQGWYEVKQGTCTNIGSDSNPETHYSSTRDIFGVGEDAVSLLAFAFTDAQNVAKDPNAQRIEVEDAMGFTLKKNGIELPDSFYTVLSNFKPKFPPKQ